MFLCVFVIALAPVILRAAPHPLVAASAVVTITRDATVEVVVRCDSLALALGAPPATINDDQMLRVLDGPRADLDAAYAQAKERFTAGLQINVSGVAIPVRELIAPTAAQAVAYKQANPSAPLPVKLEFIVRADLPRDSKSLSLKFPELLGDVILTVQTPGEEPLATPVRAGEQSDEYGYNLSAPVIPGTVPATAGPGPAASAPLPNAATPGDPPHAAPSAGTWKAALGFIRVGFLHIIPEGLDHILFVLGLFFLSPKIRPLLVQITCFTIAHSVTLALSARGVISLPGSVVEPAIAGSIAFVAIENLCTQKVHAWRPIIVFCFGLIHGLGFASAMSEAMGTSTTPLGVVLLFNVGVEFGQLAVMAIALLTVGWFRNKPWYRSRIAIPASVLIAGMGVYWVIQRVFFA